MTPLVNKDYFLFLISHCILEVLFGFTVSILKKSEQFLI